MVGSVTIAVVGGREVAKELGKKGTSSDITLYNAVRDGHALTVVEPTQFPERFPPLLFALAMSDRVVLTVPGLSREVAETLATLEMFDRPIVARLGPEVGADELRRLLKGSALEALPLEPLDMVHLRAEVDGWLAEERPGPVQVPVDHAFPVKGVGTVALGVVRQGTLRAHDRLRLYPTEAVVEVRSVQVHDVDVREASRGERVGVALKGVEADQVGRGFLLAPDGSVPVGSRVGGGFARSRYYRGPLAVGGQLQLLLGLQLVPARIRSLDAASIELETDRPIAMPPGEPAVLADLSPPSGPRIVGRVLTPA